MLVIRGVILIGLLGWYSAAVWRMIDGYFKEQFQAYLQEEYRRDPRMRSDVENTVVRSVDKVPAATGGVCCLPTEFSRVVDFDDTDVCPADIADNCLLCRTHNDDERASREPMKKVTGGTSENVAVGTTDKNAFLENRTRPSLESRKPPIVSDRHNNEWRASVINQEGDYRERKKKVKEEEEVVLEKEKEESTEGREISDGVLLASSAIMQRPEKSRYWVDRGAFGKLDASKTFSETLSEKRTIKKRRVNTIALRDIDYHGASIGRQEEDNDFLEFEDEDEKKEEEKMSQKIPDEGILVSELPFKPEVDIDDLNRITAEEFCPLTLEDDSSCGETITWP